MVTDTRVTYKRQRAWQRALDVMVHIHQMTAPLEQRQADPLARTLWEAGLELMRHITEAAEVGQLERKRWHLREARRQASRVNAQLLVARQLRLVDVERDVLELVERVRQDLEQWGGGLRS